MVARFFHFSHTTQSANFWVLGLFESIDHDVEQ
jgi:hypothetical protein